jgi:hypothetical protein
MHNGTQQNNLFTLLSCIHRIYSFKKPSLLPQLHRNLRSGSLINSSSAYQDHRSSQVAATSAVNLGYSDSGLGGMDGQGVVAGAEGGYYVMATKDHGSEGEGEGHNDEASTEDFVFVVCYHMVIMA